MKRLQLPQCFLPASKITSAFPCVKLNAGSSPPQRKAGICISSILPLGEWTQSYELLWESVRKGKTCQLFLAQGPLHGPNPK